MKKLVKPFAIALMSIGIVAVGADMQSAIQSGKDAATSAVNQAQSSTLSNLDPTSVPHYAGTDVPETGYYSDGGTIEARARTQLPSSQAGTAVTNNAVTRPRFLITADDPEIAQEQHLLSTGTALTQSYSGCHAVAVSSAPQSWLYRTCSAGSVSPTPSCTRQLQTSCVGTGECEAANIAVQGISSDMTWSYAHPVITLGTIADNYWQSSCGYFDRTTTFTIDDVRLMKEFRLIEVGFDDWMLVQVNGQTVFVGPYGGDRLTIQDGRVIYSPSGQNAACELKTNWRQTANVDLLPLLRSGQNTIRILVVVAGDGEGWVKIRSTKYCDCSANDHYTTSCPVDVSGSSCQQTGSVCTQGPETRMVDGFPVYRSCWAWTDRYQCPDYMNQEDATCASYRADGCQQIGSSCTQHNTDGSCAHYRQDFRCPQGGSSTSTATLCGEDLYCPDGNCANEYRTPEDSTGDMGKALTYVAAMQNAGGNFDPETFDFFAGEAKRCNSNALGFSNCCKGSGWGNDVGLASCSTEEKTLGTAREAEQTHFVGTHSSGSFIDRRDYETYCTFTSKLTRIIQEQGRPQLGLGWGTSREPDCRAFTQDEMQRLDWTAMNLSEFFDDAVDQASTAAGSRETNAAIEQRMRQQVQQMSTTGSPSNTSH